MQQRNVAPQINFGTEQLDALNEVAPPGHYLVMPTAQRLEIAQRNGNAVCPYVNDFNGEHGYVAQGPHRTGAFFGHTADERASMLLAWHAERWWVEPGPGGKPDRSLGTPLPGTAASSSTSSREERGEAIRTIRPG